MRNFTLSFFSRHHSRHPHNKNNTTFQFRSFLQLGEPNDIPFGPKESLFHFQSILIKFNANFGQFGLHPIETKHENQLCREIQNDFGWFLWLLFFFYHWFEFLIHLLTCVQSGEGWIFINVLLSELKFVDFSSVGSLGADFERFLVRKPATILEHLSQQRVMIWPIFQHVIPLLRFVSILFPTSSTFLFFKLISVVKF